MNNPTQILKVTEIFSSIQGEGANQGRYATFIRLSSCNLTCSFCDTEFDSFVEMSISDILEKINRLRSTFLIWTGGEPLMQLDKNIIDYFKANGFQQAIETNGTLPCPDGIDYITCSPKNVSLERLRRNFPNGVSEFRFPLSADSPDPPSIAELPHAKDYFVSPIFDERDHLVLVNVDRCMNFIKNNPEWRISIQIHKLIAVP